MRRAGSTPVLAVLAAALATSLAACGESCRRQSATLLGFEGEIELAMGGGFAALSGGLADAGAGPTTLVRVKGDRMRIEMRNPLMSFVYVFDSSRHVGFLIDDKARTYTVLTMKDRTGADASLAGAVKPRKTGSAFVAGHPCTLWETTASSMRAEACMADDLGSPLLPEAQKLFGGGGSVFEELGGHGFPLRLRTFDSSGAVVFSMEAVRVEKKGEADSLFEPPRGYAAIDAGVF